MGDGATLGVATLQTQVDNSDLDDGLNKAKRKTNSFLSSVGEGFKQRIGMNVADAALQAGQAVVQFTKDSMEEFKTFEAGMAEVFTLMGDSADEAFKSRMERDVLDFSQQVGRTTDEVLPALYQSISAGVPSENVFDFMQVASDAALGGVTDLETAVDGITSVVNAYGSEVIDATTASDTMFTAVKLGKTDFEQLSSSLFNVVPTAASLGVSFDDVAASLAALTAQGTPTSVATTQLRAAFVEASKTGTKLDQALREMVGGSFAELIASGMTSTEIFNALRESMPEQEFKDLFGSVEAMNAVLGLTNNTAESIIGSFTDVEGATAAAAETMKDTAAFVDGEFTASWEAFQIVIGDGTLPVMTVLKKEFTELIQVVTNAIQIGRDLQFLLSEIGRLGKQRFLEGLTDGFDALAQEGSVVQEWVDRFRDSTEEATASVDAEASSMDDLVDVTNEYTEATEAQIDAEEKLAEATTETNLQYEMNVALAQDRLAHDEEIIVTSDMVAEAEKRREEQAKLLAEAEAEALRIEQERTAQLGSYFDSALTATEADMNWEMQLYNSAVAAGAGATELALLAAATGEFTTEQIEAAFQAALMQANIDRLVESMMNGTITADEASLALNRLKENENLTADEAMALSSSISDANSQLDTMSGSALDAANNVASIPSYKETTYRFKVEADPMPSVVSGPSGKGQGGTSAAAFMYGGYTGRGPMDGIAGLVHYDELVVPRDVLNRGSGAILDFASSNVPELGQGAGGLGGNKIEINIDARGSNLQEGQIRAEVEAGINATGLRARTLSRVGY